MMFNNNEKKIYNYEIMAFPNKKSNFGNYSGTYPKEAAQKAFSFLSTLVDNEIKDDGNFLVFSIRKKNKNNINNSNKEHKFIGTVIELDNYVYSKSLGKKVKFKNVISRYNPELDKIKAVNKNIRYNK